MVDLDGLLMASLRVEFKGSFEEAGVVDDEVEPVEILAYSTNARIES